MELGEWLLSQRDYSGAYHHHKEQMAYAATTLYLAVATAVIVQGPKQLGLDHLDRWYWWLLVAGTPIVAFLFVIWQLWNRRCAADVVAACVTAASNQLARDPNEPLPNRTPTPYGKRKGQFDLPQFLIEEINTAAERRGRFGGAVRSEIITYVAMGFWTLAALARLWYS